MIRYLNFLTFSDTFRGVMVVIIQRFDKDIVICKLNLTSKIPGGITEKFRKVFGGERILKL